MTEAATVAATIDVVVVGVQGERAFHYWDFDNTKLPYFDGGKDLNVVMRRLSDVECCFITCSFSDDQKLKCPLNLLWLE